MLHWEQGDRAAKQQWLRMINRCLLHRSTNICHHLSLKFKHSVRCFSPSGNQTASNDSYKVEVQLAAVTLKLFRAFKWDTLHGLYKISERPVNIFDNQTPLRQQMFYCFISYWPVLFCYSHLQIKSERVSVSWPWIEQSFPVQPDLRWPGAFLSWAFPCVVPFRCVTHHE